MSEIIDYPHYIKLKSLNADLYKFIFSTLMSKSKNESINEATILTIFIKDVVVSETSNFAQHKECDAFMFLKYILRQLILLIYFFYILYIKENPFNYSQNILKIYFIILCVRISVKLGNNLAHQIKCIFQKYFVNKNNNSSKKGLSL